MKDLIKPLFSKRLLCIPALLAMTSLHAHGYTYEHPPTRADQDMLAQIQGLYGLDEEGAIRRLAAEEQASEVYFAIRSAGLESYAGAWFDASTQALKVAISDGRDAVQVRRLGGEPVNATWSLKELEAARDRVMRTALALSPTGLRTIAIDYPTNRVALTVATGHADRLRSQFGEDEAKLILTETDGTPELSADVRGADGTRNAIWAVDYSHISTEWPCSIGASVENGYYTAGHCGYAGHTMNTASGDPLSNVVISDYYPNYTYDPYDAPTLDMAWAQTVAGQTPTPKVNGYSDGVLSVPAKWAGTLEAPLFASVCRYGQTSGGPHCGTVIQKNAKINFGVEAYSPGYFNYGVTVVSGSCSSDGDSGGSWLSASGGQIQGTNTGGTPVNTCPTPATQTYFQPISHHIGSFADHLTTPAGSLLTTHGASAPSLSGLVCPDMSSSGSGTYHCDLGHYNSQGVTTLSWSASSGHSSSALHLFGTCTKFSTVVVTLNVTNPYGTTTQVRSFPCPTGPIP